MTDSISRLFRYLPWIGLALLGSFALGTIALSRGEQIGAIWLLTAAICFYLIGYRFYSRIVAYKIFALDERGRSVTTQGLSVMLSDWMRDGSHPAFVIGGADGLSDEVRARASKLLSLSPLTLPHALVRVVLAEQLYRAWSRLSRHPYHRE